MAFDTFHQGDEETLPDQQRDNDIFVKFGWNCEIWCLGVQNEFCYYHLISLWSSATSITDGISPLRRPSLLIDLSFISTFPTRRAKGRFLPTKLYRTNPFILAAGVTTSQTETFIGLWNLWIATPFKKPNHKNKISLPFLNSHLFLSSNCPWNYPWRTLRKLEENWKLALWWIAHVMLLTNVMVQDPWTSMML